jgi:putative endopeptidase
MALTNPHPPNQFRANGPLSHIDAFYAAFDVQPGDKLYVEPAKRVRIW